MEILPPSRHGPAGQDKIRPVLAVERPRSAVDAAEQFAAQRLTQSNAQVRREQLRDEPDTQGKDAGTPDRQAATAQLLSFPGHGAGMAATGFVAQVLAQNLDRTSGEAGNSELDGQLPGGSGGNAALGSDAYRRAGGEPTIYGEEPAYFRVAV